MRRSLACRTHRIELAGKYGEATTDHCVGGCSGHSRRLVGTHTRRDG